MRTTQTIVAQLERMIVKNCRLLSKVYRFKEIPEAKLIKRALIELINISSKLALDIHKLKFLRKELKQFSRMGA